jgi:hypothetical protein
MARLLITLSALIVFSLGTLHLVYTFATRKFHPRDAGLKTQMEHSPLVLTSQTTLWRAWIGFNASHSLGAMLFGVLYAYLAMTQAHLLFHSWVLLGVGLAFLGSFLCLAHRYWFKIPFLGLVLSITLYLSGVAVAWTSSLT